MTENLSFSRIQGNVSRNEQLGDLTLTDTSYSPGLRLYPHAHEHACFGAVLAGGFSEKGPAGKLFCSARAVFFRPPQVVHENRVSGEGARCFYVELSPGWVSRIAEYGSLPDQLMSFESGTLQKLANCVYAEWQDMDEAAPLAIEGLACQMAAQVCRVARLEREPRPPLWLARVNEILRCRFQSPIRLADLAREVGIHPVHLAREFRRYYGVTVGEFRRKCRIDFACDRLVRSNLAIIEIALESGFAQQPHFTSVFKRITGLTPCRYRKLRTRRAID